MKLMNSFKKEISIVVNEIIESDDLDDEEFDLDNPSDDGDTLTYFAINDTSEDGIRWITVGLFHLINTFIELGSA